VLVKDLLLPIAASNFRSVGRQNLSSRRILNV